MSATMLHLLDSLHDWLVFLVVFSVVGGPFSVLGLVSYEQEKKSDDPDYGLAIKVGVGTAVAFVLAVSLAIFLPTPKSMGEIADRERRQRMENLEADKKAAKLAYCIANPGKCK